MSWAEVIPLGPNAPSRLGHFLLLAMTCSVLAAPTGMLWTKLLASKAPRIEMMPIEDQPRPTAPSPQADMVVRETPPLAVLPPDSATLEGEPPSNALARTAPEAPIPALALLASPGISAIPSEAGSVPTDIAGGMRSVGVGTSGHSQVLALLRSLAHRKSELANLPQLLRSNAARERLGGRSTGTTPLSATVSTTAVAAPSVGGRTPARGLLGGPAGHHASNMGLNGTAMRPRS